MTYNDLVLSRKMSEVHTADDLLQWVRYAANHQTKRERLILALALKRKVQNAKMVRSEGSIDRRD